MDFHKPFPKSTLILKNSSRFLKNRLVTVVFHTLSPKKIITTVIFQNYTAPVNGEPIQYKQAQTTDLLCPHPSSSTETVLLQKKADLTQSDYCTASDNDFDWAKHLTGVLA